MYEPPATAIALLIKMLQCTQATQMAQVQMLSQTNSGKMSGNAAIDIQQYLY